MVRQSGGGATKWTYLMMAIGIAWATGGLKTMCWWALYALLGFIVMLYCNQNGMLYAPAPPGMPKRPAENPPMMRSPAEFGMNYKDVKVECADGVKLSAWMITQVRGPLLTPDRAEKVAKTLSDSVCAALRRGVHRACARGLGRGVGAVAMHAVGACAGACVCACPSK